MNVDIYTANDTWTAPAGVSSPVLVNGWGSGGDGGPGDGDPGTNNGGGGGGGAFGRKFMTVVATTGYAVVTGAGNTTFNGSGNFLILAGDDSVDTNGAAGGSAAGCVADVAYDGGAGDDAAGGSDSGAGGGAAGLNSGGGAAVNPTGGTAGLYGGAGADAQSVSGQPGIAGTAPGGAGSGGSFGSSPTAGGAGADGKLFIQYVTNATGVVFDAFIDGQDVSLASHTGQIGATWTLASSPWDSVSSINVTSDFYCELVNGIAGASVYGASGAPATDDYDVIVTMHCYSLDGAREAGVMGRANIVSGDGYFLTYDIGFGANALRLYTYNAFTPTLLDEYEVDFTPGTDYVIKLEMRGTAIKGYIDGVERVSVTDSDHTTGVAALQLYDTPAGSGTSIRQFQVLNPSSGVSIPVIVHCHKQQRNM